MAALKPGDRINNYLVEARVGAGTFGEVWRARHHVFGDIVAIKVPTDTQFVRNLQREGVAVHGLRHPNVVRVTDLDPYADPPYLIMEYVDGPSLRSAIDQFGASFPVASAVAVLRGVLSALAAAHAGGLVHRDIKPENILLNRSLLELQGLSEVDVKVTDFGLGQVGGVTAQAIMQSGSLVNEAGRSLSGTLAYMSPEQKDGRAVDGRSDLYSCGIVLFEMLTGERPQGTDLPSTLRSGMPRVLDAVFQRLYTRYDRRFASAEDVLRMLAGGGVSRGPARPVPPALPGSNRSAASSDRLHCPRCQGVVLSDDQFCIACGTQLVHSVPRCPACQGFVHRSDRYCIFCGASLEVRAG